MEYKARILTKVIQQIFLSKRHRLGLTQLGLSMESNITRQFISQVEGGKRAPSIFTMSALASVSKQSLTDLFKEIDSLYERYQNIDSGNYSTADKAAAENESQIYIKKIHQDSQHI